MATISTVHKATQTARASTITLADDPELIFASVAAGTYRLKAFLQFQGSVTGTQGAQFAIRAGTSHPTSGWLNAQGIVNNAAFPPVLWSSGGAVVQLSNISTAIFDFLNFESVFSHPGGAIAMQWSQRSSSANATLLNTLSWMEIVSL